MRLLSLYYHYNLSELANASVTYFNYNVHPVDPYVSSLKVSCTILLLNARFQLQPYFIPCQQPIQHRYPYYSQVSLVQVLLIPTRTITFHLKF